MRRARVSSALGGASRTAAALAAVRFLPIQHQLCHRSKPKLCGALGEGGNAAAQHCDELEHVLSQLRLVHGVNRLDPNVEAVVSGRGRHLGIAVNWSLRWTAAGCFLEEIRGPQLTFKWGYDGQPGSGCWEVDSSGLVRVMECDDHEAVLLTAHIRTGCWLQPHLRASYDMELLPPPPTLPPAPPPTRAPPPPASGGNGESSTGSSGGKGGAPKAQSTSGGASADRHGCSSSDGSSGGGERGDRASGGAGPGPGPASVAAPREELVAIGVRVRGGKLRVRVLVRRRDWRLLAFDHRLCADVETWELGEWRRWGDGVLYPSSALHKSAAGSQHAYLTSAGGAERRQPPAQALLRARAQAAGALLAAAAAPPPEAEEPSSASCSSRHPASLPSAPSESGRQRREGRRQDTVTEVTEAAAAAAEAVAAAAAEPLPPPTWFGLPPLPPIPPDTTYDFPCPPSSPEPDSSFPASASSSSTSASASAPSSSSSSCASDAGDGPAGSCQRVPLWRAASGHYLVRPRINGQEGGYFVLDTGASGFVLTPAAAARLGGSAFGETHAASVAGKVAARFVRLGRWELGGVALAGPVLMVMGLEGLVRGAPGEVVGIVGHDLFRRAVVELPQLVGATAPTRGSLLGSGGAAARPAGGPGDDSGSGSETDAGLWSDGDAAAGPGSSPPAPAAQTAVGRGQSAATGGGGAATAAFGPPPSPPRSTPAFPENASGSGAGSAAAGARGTPIGAAAAAATLPSPLGWGTCSATEEREGGSGASASGHLTDCGGDAGDKRSTSNIGSSSSITSGSSNIHPHFSSSSSSSACGGSSIATSSSGRGDAGSGSESDGSDGSKSSDGASTSTDGGGGGSARGSAAGDASGLRRRRAGGRSPTARALARAARSLPYSLHELVLHHPLQYGNEAGWVWEPLVMIANLPHVRLRFADPSGATHSCLLMVDSGACGADIMIHDRAQREMGLLTAAAAAAEKAAAADKAAAGGGQGGGDRAGAGGGRSVGHYLRGVGADQGYVQLQVLELPWLQVAGVRFEQVTCMCAAVGGLDISLYSGGILCGDLLARLPWAIDYTHKRIGFRPGAFAPAPPAVPPRTA